MASAVATLVSTKFFYGSFFCVIRANLIKQDSTAKRSLLDKTLSKVFLGELRFLENSGGAFAAN